MLYTSNRRYFDRMTKQWEAFESEDLVTVAIPARNEEMHIEACVRSLQQQKHQNLEILVLDDNSTDATASLVLELQKQDNRIRLISGKPLEHGWRGKLFAMQSCTRPAEVPTFSSLMPIHAIPPIRFPTASLLASQKGKMISGYPKQIARRWPLALRSASCFSIPHSSFLSASKLPFAVAAFFHGHRTVPDDQAEALTSMGGFVPIKGQICDDVALARLCAKRGHKQLFAPMQTALQCEMFTSFSQGWKSLERSINGVVKQGLLGFFLILLIVLVLLLLSFAPVLSVVFEFWLFDQSYLLPCIFSSTAVCSCSPPETLK